MFALLSSVAKTGKTRLKVTQIFSNSVTFQMNKPLGVVVYVYYCDQLSCIA